MDNMSLVCLIQLHVASCTSPSHYLPMLKVCCSMKRYTFTCVSYVKVISIAMKVVIVNCKHHTLSQICYQAYAGEQDPTGHQEGLLLVSTACDRCDT